MFRNTIRSHYPQIPETIDNFSLEWQSMHIEKNIYGPQMVKNSYSPPIAKNIYGPQKAENI